MPSAAPATSARNAASATSASVCVAARQRPRLTMSASAAATPAAARKRRRQASAPAAAAMKIQGGTKRNERLSHRSRPWIAALTPPKKPPRSRSIQAIAAAIQSVIGRTGISISGVGPGAPRLGQKLRPAPGDAVERHREDEDGEPSHDPLTGIELGDGAEDLLAKPGGADERRDDDHRQRHHEALVDAKRDGGEGERQLHLGEEAPVRAAQR